MKMLYLVPILAAATQLHAAAEINVLTKEVPVQSADATNAALSQSSEGLVEVRMPDGSTMIDLQGRFQMTSVAEVQGDGRVKTTCDTQEASHTHVSAKPLATDSNER